MCLWRGSHQTPQLGTQCGGAFGYFGWVAARTGEARLNIIYDYNNELKFSLSNLFVGSRYRLGDESNSYPKAKSYNIYNGKLKYNINDMKISFKINNILDKNYYHYDSYGSIYPLPGRNFSLNFNYSF